MNRTRKLPASLHSVRQEGRKNNQYQAGYEAGYALGLRLGEEDRGSVFEGTSFLIPVQAHADRTIHIIRQLEKQVSHPYEILVADAGATPSTKQYIHDRSGAVRHIKGNRTDSIGALLNQAVSISQGEFTLLLINDFPDQESWPDKLRQEFEVNSAIKVVYISTAPSSASGQTYDPLSNESVNAVLFRRSLWSSTGKLDEHAVSLETALKQWLERIPAEQRIRIDASDFISIPSR
ncbi:hypothetical protein JCM10914A_32590 [Paenibacillus sp. JCM 10914]|uniref:glycosyltransferase family 2 protein n=1 Tax=Paenibacillus sp. JCM 10914 TaxID=1236974 RepID=UPI0003CC7157|nr:hypothetical protein [Paenibacillus sp. JCM 10914]GAE07530.1 hypothetical protein JCM10914_3764 [Paenibacillus sp. JCM 10914]